MVVVIYGGLVSYICIRGFSLLHPSSKHDYNTIAQVWGFGLSPMHAVSNFSYTDYPQLNLAIKALFNNFSL